VRRLPDIPEAHRAWLVSESKAKRFADLYSVEPDTGCFTWTGTLRSGRSPFRAGRRTVSAPPWEWAKVHGSLPEGRWLKPFCGNAARANSNHLKSVVPAQMVGGHERTKTAQPGTPRAPRTLTLRQAESGCAGPAGACDHSVTKGPPAGLLDRDRKPVTCGFSAGMQLGGEDSNPQWQGQNLLCCRLHHPRRAPTDASRRRQGAAPARGLSSRMPPTVSWRDLRAAGEVEAPHATIRRDRQGGGSVRRRSPTGGWPRRGGPRCGPGPALRATPREEDPPSAR
jgi:hypothetical protein